MNTAAPDPSAFALPEAKKYPHPLDYSLDDDYSRRDKDRAYVDGWNECREEMRRNARNSAPAAAVGGANFEDWFKEAHYAENGYVSSGDPTYFDQTRGHRYWARRGYIAGIEWRDKQAPAAPVGGSVVGSGWTDVADGLPPVSKNGIASERVVVTDGKRIYEDVCYYNWKPAEHDFMQSQFGDFRPRFYSGALRWMTVADAFALLDSPAAQSSAKDGVRGEGLCERLQRKCYDWGTYWRAPDAHGVDLTLEQALELLRDALGVEVEIQRPCGAWPDGAVCTKEHEHSGPCEMAGQEVQAIAWVVFDRKNDRYVIFNKELADAIADRGLLVLPVYGAYEWQDPKTLEWKPINRLPYTWERELGIEWRALEAAIASGLVDAHEVKAWADRYEIVGNDLVTAYKAAIGREVA